MNPQTLYLFKNLNNYFNRKVVLKDIRTLQEIETNSKLVAIKDNMNISIGDGIRTKLTVSFNDADMVQYNNDLINGDPKAFPDYAIIKLETQSGEITLSRWFIIESNKISYGNYNLVLQRDVVADYYEEINTSMLYLEKGFVSQSNPLIFNNENMSFNQIKKREILLKDISQCGWIVGYIAKQNNNKEKYTIEAEIETSTINADYQYDELPQNIVEAFEDGRCVGRLQKIIMTLDIKNDRFYCRGKNIFDANGNFQDYVALTNQMFFWNDLPIGNAEIIFPNYNIETDTLFKDTYSYSGSSFEPHLNDSMVLGAYARGFVPARLSGRCNLFLTNLSYYIPDILEYDNKIIELDSGAFVRIKITKAENETIFPTISNNNALMTEMTLVEPNYGSSPKPWQQNKVFNRQPKTGDIACEVEAFNIALEPITGTPISITIPTTRNACVDAPFDMFAIPYGGLNESGNKDDALRIATGLTQALGDYLYDLQLLPYCPAQDFIDYDVRAIPLPGRIVPVYKDNLTENYDYVSVQDENEEEITRIIFPIYSKQNFILQSKPKLEPGRRVIYPPILNYNSEISNYENESIGLKVLDQAYLFRFVSPNYASVFEFSLAKNELSVDFLVVNLNYKPYNPFIRVAPNFKGMYNMEFTDQRGLICGGDYSLSIISNAWTNYEINNKNYQLIFDRQIQNLGVSQEIASEKQALNFFNILPTTLASVLGGSMVGGGIGGALAGATGLGTALLNTSMQADWLGRSQKEAKSYLTDNFNYTLGNIKAIPNTLAKVSSLNEVNKIFPFIEVYEATDEEKQLFASKLHYNGMTINKVVGLGSYIGSLPESEVFIKGQLIRMDNANADSHITYQIYEELLKGIYIDKGDYTG